MRLSIFTDNNLSKSARDNNDGQYDGHLFCEQDQACSRDGSRSKDSNRKVTLQNPYLLLRSAMLFNFLKLKEIQNDCLTNYRFLRKDNFLRSSLKNCCD